MSQDEVLTIEDVAAIVEMAEKTVYSMAQAGERPAFEIRGQGCVRRKDSNDGVERVRKLIQINRDAMRNVDEEARRLGGAGAWAAVFVGFLSFLLSVFVLVRFQNRFIRPLVDLHEVLEGAREGDRLRRCRLHDAPREVIQVTQAVNRLLDERLERTNGHSAEETT
jgi:nitrogen fixation/metabolism regulation signal transduction histidine kinase